MCAAAAGPCPLHSNAACACRHLPAHDSNCYRRKKRTERKAAAKAQRVASARPRPGSSVSSDAGRPRLGSPLYPDVERGLAHTQAPLPVYQERDEEEEEEDMSKDAQVYPAPFVPL